MLNTSQRLVNKNSLTWWYVFKTSWRCLQDVFARRLEDVLKTSWRRLENVLKTSWRGIEDVFARRLEVVLKTSWRRMEKTNILVLTKTSWTRLEHVIWRRMINKNIFVFIKTSWRRLEDVFWRRRRKTNVFWVETDERITAAYIFYSWTKNNCNSRYASMKLEQLACHASLRARLVLACQRGLRANVAKAY